MISLPHLANEILDEIVSYIPTQADQLSIMSCCRGLFWPTARHLYRHVSVSDYKARRFFKTITESTLGYGHFIKTLTYDATSNTDIHLNHLLLRDAIPRLVNLEDLSLKVRAALSPFLIYHLKKSDNLKKIHALERLRTFRLDGDVRLLRLLAYDRIKKLVIAETMSDEEFTYFLGIVVFPTSMNNPVITDLTLTFCVPLREQVMYVMVRVAECFPNLRRLAIRALNLHALEQDISLAMTLKPPLLPHLCELKVNQISMVRPDEDASLGESAYDMQHTHVIEAGRLRSGLYRVTFGQLAFDRVPLTDNWTRSYHINATDEDMDMLPDNFRGRPLEWLVEYSEPIAINELQAFYAKHASIKGKFKGNTNDSS